MTLLLLINSNNKYYFADCFYIDIIVKFVSSYFKTVFLDMDILLSVWKRENCQYLSQVFKSEWWHAYALDALRLQLQVIQFLLNWCILISLDYVCICISPYFLAKLAVRNNFFLWLTLTINSCIQPLMITRVFPGVLLYLVPFAFPSFCFAVSCFEMVNSPWLAEWVCEWYSFNMVQP